MFDIGGGELMLILIVVLIAFGPKKLPELAQSLGRGIREFKRAQRDFTDQINNAIELEQRKANRTVSRRPPAGLPNESRVQRAIAEAESSTNSIQPSLFDQTSAADMQSMEPSQGATPPAPIDAPNPTPGATPGSEDRTAS